MMTKQKKNSAVKAVSFMMLITLFGKVLGLVREQLLAANYGNGMEANAFTIASLMPRTFFDAVFASAISASFIPIFNEYLQKKGKEEAFALSNRFITLMGAVTILMTLVCEVFSSQFVWLFAGGFDAETTALAAGLSRVMFPTIFFTGVAFSFVGILQSLDEFNIPAALSVASNAVIIIYYILWNDRFGVYGLAVAFLIGWGLQALMQIPSMRKKGYHYRPSFHFRDEGIRKIMVLMLPVMVGTWIQPINLLINNRFASLLDMTGTTLSYGNTALQYANNLYLIIVGVFVLAIANLVFPKLSRITGDSEDFGQTVRVTLRSMMFFLIPMMVGVMVLSKPFVKLIYERGSFDAVGTELTGTALCFFSIGMIGYGVQTILSRAFYAQQEGKMPLVAGVFSIAVNAALCVLLMEPMGLGGLALASAVSSTVAALVLFVPTVKKYPGILDGALVRDLCKMAFCAGVMLVCVWLPYRFLAARLADGLITRLILVCVPTGIGVVVYMALTYLFRVEESRMAFDIVGKLLRHGKPSLEEGAQPEQKEEQKGKMGMTDRISAWIEDSFFFRIIQAAVIWFWGIWSASLTYRAYHRLGQAVGRAFRESAIFGFFRRDWDFGLRAERSRIPRVWRRLSWRGGEAVAEKRGLLASLAAESGILRLCNQNFLILCICVTALAIPVLPTMLLVVLCLGIIGLYLINLWMGRIRIQKTGLVSVFVGLFALCIVYGSFTSYHFPRALQVMAVFLVFMAMFFVCKDCIDTERKLDLVLFVLVAAGVLIALYAIYQYVVGVEMDAAWVDADSFDITTRAYATFQNPNVLGEYLIVIGSLAAGMLWKVRNWAGRVFYLVCFGMICMGLVATNSRGAMLGLMFSAGLFVLLAERRLIPLGILGLLAMPFVLPQSLWERLLSSITMSDSSSQYRLSIYQAGMDIVRHYWQTGIGVDAFNEIYPLFSLEAANAYHVHNLFLQEFIELGIVGILILVLLLVFFFQKAYSAMARAPRRYHMILAAVFGAFGGLLLQGMTDHIWFDYSIVLLFWCVLGIGMAGVRLGERTWHKRK